MNGQTPTVLQRPPGYRDPTAPVQNSPRPPPVRKPLPPSFYQTKKRRSCCCRFCCCLSIFFSLIIFLLIVAAGIFYIWFEPRLPVFHLYSIQFPRFNITVRPDGSYLDSQTVLRLEVKNPNSELRLIYDRTEVWLTLDSMDLGSTTSTGFTQEKKNVTILRFETRVNNMLVDDGVGKTLKDGFRAKSLMVHTEVQTGVGMGSGGWNTNTVGFKVLCGGLSLKEIESGAMPKCSINVLKWINIHV